MHRARTLSVLQLTLVAASVLAGESIAGAQAAQHLAATDYLVEYTRHAHGYYEEAPIVPRLSEGTVWSGLHTALMQQRKGQGLYLLGDEDLHLFPTRVGILGWGFSMGVRF